jgi:hypothetical protein
MFFDGGYAQVKLVLDRRLFAVRVSSVHRSSSHVTRLPLKYVHPGERAGQEHRGRPRPGNAEITHQRDAVGVLTHFW